MRSTIRTRILLPVSIFFLAIAVAAAAGGYKLKSFAGSLQGQETDVLQGNPPHSISVDGTVTGIATHLGRFTLRYQVSVKLPEGTSTGFSQLTAANGDTIFATIIGLGQEVPGTPGLAKVIEINTITEGTGRFAGAKGNYTIDRLVDLGTGQTSGSFQGTISLPSAK